MKHAKWITRIAGILALSLLTACTAEPAPFTLELSPEFVQGAVPGAQTGVLVTVDSSFDDPVALTATAEGAEVTVTPAEIGVGEVAEVIVVPGETTTERPLDIVVTGYRDGVEESATKSTTVFPWEDDRSDYAGSLLDLFTAWLAQHEPDLGLGPETEFSGSFVAPGLLVVSHYLYRTDRWEVGLSWHVMVPPDDWAEVYLRPLDESAPTMAFRLHSQAAALEDGLIEIEPVAAPLEVVR